MQMAAVLQRQKFYLCLNSDWFLLSLRPNKPTSSNYFLHFSFQLQTFFLTIVIHESDLLIIQMTENN
jgi:hypothetical protein